MNEYLIKTLKLDDEQLKIYIDPEPINPRDWDNLGKMICWHNRYDLGDKHDYTIDEFHEFLEKTNTVTLPLFLLDHSGLRMKNTSFNDPWDSGKVGYIYITYDDIRKEYDRKRVSKKLITQVYKILQGETETYNQYISGDTYCYTLSKLITCNLNEVHEEFIDSCGGFYGFNFKENGLLDHVGQKWRNLL